MLACTDVSSASHTYKAQPEQMQALTPPPPPQHTHTHVDMHESKISEGYHADLEAEIRGRFSDNGQTDGTAECVTDQLGICHLCSASTLAVKYPAGRNTWRNQVG